MKVKTWTMKKTILLLVPVLIIGMFTCAQAATVGPDPFYQGVLDPVCFWVVDDSNDSSVTATGISFLLPTGYALQYYSDVTDWTNFGTSVIFNTGSDPYELVRLRLYNSTTYATDTSGDLTFLGYEVPDDGYGLGWYTSITIDWDGTNNVQLSFVSSAGNDNVAPVPIPASVLLLGSGILGLIAIGRVKRKDS